VGAPLKILMTGATGFIGRTMLTTLASNGDACEITAVTRRTPPAAATGVRWIVADLGVRDWTAALPEAAFDVVVHLAQSEHYRDFPAHAADIVAVNVEATVALAEWATRHAVERFLFASSGSVYGSSDRVHREDDPCRPDTMYAASKLAAEILLQPFSSRMDTLALRLFGVYGPGQTNAILPNVIRRFDAGEEITLAGSAGVRFNPIFIDDCATLIRRFITRALAGFHVLNVCGSEIVDLRDAVAILEAEAGRKANARITMEAPVLLVGSTDRLHRTSEYPAGVSFRDGLVRTYRHAHSTGVV
jgi:nucleoside-diphosphate-sugar epimerase